MQHSVLIVGVGVRQQPAVEHIVLCCAVPSYDGAVACCAVLRWLAHKVKRTSFGKMHTVPTLQWEVAVQYHEAGAGLSSLLHFYTRACQVGVMTRSYGV